MNNDSIAYLEEKAKEWELDLYKRNGERETLLKILEEKRIIHSELDADIIKLDKVLALFQKTSNYAREQAKRQIEMVVTKCLQNIFQQPYEFQIVLNKKRDLANAEFYIVSSYGDETIANQPELDRGGGIVDIISLALRIAFLELIRPKLEGPLMLDEPGKHVSEDYIFNLGNFLAETANAFNRQMIMVTHNPHLLAIGDSCFIVSQNNGISYVKPAELEGNDES
ncbi:MAG: ATPase [Tissierellia bacterium]|nr:ATPase [Tissierellia bacterium]